MTWKRRVTFYVVLSKVGLDQISAKYQITATTKKSKLLVYMWDIRLDLGIVENDVMTNGNVKFDNILI